MNTPAMVWDFMGSTVLALSALAIIGFGQTPTPQRKVPPKPVAPKSVAPFGLKADQLGESLEEFRAKNDRVISLGPLGQYHAKLDTSLLGTKHFPQCTNDRGNETDKEIETLLSWDVKPSALTEEETRTKVIRCVTAPSVDDDFDFADRPTVAEIEAYRTVYYFFQEKLYLIRSTLPRVGYPDIRAAFQEKYGVPVIHAEQYQNALGATFVGENLLWDNEVSKISIEERGSDHDSQTVSASKDIVVRIRSTIIETLAIGKGYEATKTAAVYANMIKEDRDRNKMILQGANLVITIWHVGLKAQFEAASASKTRGKDI
jgi:hypothetical protein